VLSEEGHQEDACIFEKMSLIISVNSEIQQFLKPESTIIVLVHFTIISMQ
jgi:hypothetical protein